MGDFVLEPPAGPYYSLQDAAAFCGWAPDTLRRYMQDYDIPRYGPRGTRFAQSTLNRFMARPEDFKKGRRSPRRRKPITLVVPDERPSEKTG